MRIVIAGGTGFIGQPLVRHLLDRNHQVAVLSRDPARVEDGEGVAWAPGQSGDWQNRVAEAEAVINLAGENIGAGRWTPQRKKQLLDSRIDATRALASIIKQNPADRPLINASAIGIYGSRGDEMLTEASSSGDDFLAQLTRRWEEEARSAETACRLVIPRFGIVLAKDGGALKKMLPPFQMFVGGPMGDGKQWMSWVDRDDLISFVSWAIENPSARGVYNVTAPHPVRNRGFASELGAVLHRPAMLPTPRLPLRLGLGEMADALLFASQRVVPEHAEKEGFQFEFPQLKSSLHHILLPTAATHPPSSEL